MRDNSLFQEALDLTYDIFSVNIGVKRDDALKDGWNKVAYFYLVQSCRTLGAVHLILGKFGKDMLHPADILVRSLFEFAMGLAYMEANLEQVSDFLEHHSGSYPTQPWGNLKEICEELGLLDH